MPKLIFIIVVSSLLLIGKVQAFEFNFFSFSHNANIWEKIISLFSIPNHVATVGHIGDQYSKESNSSYSDLSEIHYKLTTGLSVWSLNGVVQRSPELESLLQQRKELFLKIAQENPSLLVSRILEPTTRAKLGTIYPDLVEQDALITGNLEVMHIDNFTDPIKSQFKYYINTGIERLNLYSPNMPNMTSGHIITVQGVRLGKFLVANSQSMNISLPPNPLGSSIGEQKTLVLLYKPENFPAPATIDEVHRRVFNGQFARYMEEQSYGKVSFSGDVYGWFNHESVGPCYGNHISADDAIKEAERHTDVSRYSRVVILTTGWGGCSSVGKWIIQGNLKAYNLSVARIGVNDSMAPSAWGGQPFSWTNLDYLLAHELGHSLGLWHSNGIDCGTASLYKECKHVEYGNVYDAMGGGNSRSLHYHAYYKMLLGWLTPADVHIITTPGIYTLQAQENATGKRLAIVSNPIAGSKFPLVIETRRGIGFDINLLAQEIRNNIAGIFIGQLGRDSVQLIDARPHEKLWHDDIEDVALFKGDVFHDEGRGIGLRVRDVDTASTTFEVGIGKPKCISAKPFIIEEDPRKESTSYMSPGDYSGIFVGMINRDSFFCRTSQFELTALLPKGFNVVDNRYSSMTLAEDDIGGLSLGFNIPKTMAYGVYVIPVTVTNKRSGKMVTWVFNVEVVPPPKILSIEPKYGPKGTDVQIELENIKTSDIQGVYIYGDSTFLHLNDFKVLKNGGSKISFAIPPEMKLFCNEEYGCDYYVTTPPGEYRIWVDIVGLLKERSTNEVEFDITSDSMNFAVSATRLHEHHIELVVTFPTTLNRPLMHVTCSSQNVGVYGEVNYCHPAHSWSNLSVNPGSVRKYAFSLSNPEPSPAQVTFTFYNFDGDRLISASDVIDVIIQPSGKGIQTISTKKNPNAPAPTPTPTPTFTSTPTPTPTPQRSSIPSMGGSPSGSLSPTPTPAPIQSFYPQPSASPEASPSQSPSPSS